MVVIAGVGVLGVGLVTIPGVMVAVDATLGVPQAERITAAKQNSKKGFINMGTSRVISYFWRVNRFDMFVISQIRGET